MSYKNPFTESVKYHSREMKKWRIASIIMGVVLFGLIVLLFTC